MADEVGDRGVVASECALPTRCQWPVGLGELPDLARPQASLLEAGRLEGQQGTAGVGRPLVSQTVEEEAVEIRS